MTQSHNFAQDNGTLPPGAARLSSIALAHLVLRFLRQSIVAGADVKACGAGVNRDRMDVGMAKPYSLRLNKVQVKNAESGSHICPIMSRIVQLLIY
jgi:hypothetical protein